MSIAEGQLPTSGRYHGTMVLDHTCSEGDTAVINDARRQIANNLATLPCASQHDDACAIEVNASKCGNTCAV
jgi:hypothetical protein